MNQELTSRLRGPAPSIPAMRDAADEIERLRSALSQSVERVKELNDATLRQAARVDNSMWPAIDRMIVDAWKLGGCEKTLDMLAMRERFEAALSAKPAEPAAQGEAAELLAYLDSQSNTPRDQHGNADIKPNEVLKAWYAKQAAIVRALAAQPHASPEQPAGRQGVAWVSEAAKDCAADLRKHAKQCHDLPKLAEDLRRLANRIESKLKDAIVYTRPAAPVGVAGEIVPSNELPDGYRMGHRDSDWWPLLGDGYISDRAYPSKAHAVLAAWQHSHEKLARYMNNIRQLALAAAPSAPQGVE